MNGSAERDSPEPARLSESAASPVSRRSPPASQRDASAPFSAPPRRGVHPLIQYGGQALAGTLLLLLVECLAVAAVHRHELVAAFEVWLALSWLWPAAVVLALPLCLGGALLSAALSVRPLRRGWLLALALLLMLPVAFGVSSGRMLAGWRRPLFMLLVAGVSAGAVWWGARPFVGLLEHLSRRGRGWQIAFVAMLLGCLQLLNQLVLVRLYPAFHIGLAVLTLWLSALLFWRPNNVAEEAPSMWRRLGMLATAIALLCVPMAYLAPARLANRDNLRLIYHEHAPLLGHAVNALNWRAPKTPSSIDDPAGEQAVKGPSLALQDRDILLISIDALRADRLHGGGYKRQTTPHIDALAATGSSFKAAYTPTPHTSYAMTSLMTGKPMRSLLRQGVARSSETLAEVLRRYDYRTAGFYPPALFFIDTPRFEHFQKSFLGFEYRKVEFASGAARVTQLNDYLKQTEPRQRLFVWVHLFEPHEPYQPDARFPFGDASIDRYDAEVAAADDAVGELVKAMRVVRPNSLVVVTADHGEEFGDHGGHYHGSSVYDEQVRVPLVMQLPGVVPVATSDAPVSLIDIMPTLLAGLHVPVSPRVSGHDLAPLVLAPSESPKRQAFAETDEHNMLAQQQWRLLCNQRAGACRLYDVASDPQQRRDVSEKHAQQRSTMERSLAAYIGRLGRFEDAGERKYPQALRRGLAGDRLAAVDIAGLLDDADVEIRRKAAEALFELKEPKVLPHLRRSLREDEDAQVKRYAALALSRMGEGAPLTLDLLDHRDRGVRRLAALALAEQRNDRGENILVAWLRAAFPAKAKVQPEPLENKRARELVAALGKIRSEYAIAPLSRVLRDVRLRIPAARALAAIGEDAGRPPLAKAFANERYRDARVELAEAIVSLGGGAEIRGAFTRFLGVPEPLPNGLELARRAELMQLIGGPRERELRRLREFANSGVTVGLVVPKARKYKGLRVILRARTSPGQGGDVRFGLAARVLSDGDRSRRVPKKAQAMVPGSDVTLHFPPGAEPRELFASLPAVVGEHIEPGEHGDFVVYATQNVRVEACAVVPLRDELPLPGPKRPTANPP